MAKIVKNSLGFDSRLEVFQDKEMFNYSVDTIMLGNFLFLGSRVNRVLEVGANNGALAIFTAVRKATLSVDALEIQKAAFNLCERNVLHNKLVNQIRCLWGDFKTFAVKHQSQGKPKYDLVVANPPFFKVGHTQAGKLTTAMKIAKTESHLTLEETICGAAKVVRHRGYFSMVLKIDRFVDAAVLLRKHGFEPKRIQLVFARVNSRPAFVLLESRYKGNCGQTYLPNIYLYGRDPTKHEYNAKTKKLYHPHKVKV